MAYLREPSDDKLSSPPLFHCWVMTFLEYVFVKRKSDHTDHLTVTKMKLVQLRQNRKTTLNNNTSRKPAAGCERTAGKSDCLFRCSSSRYTSVSNYFAMVKFGKICICTKWWTAGWTNFLFLKFQHSRERVCCIQKNAGQMNQGEGFWSRVSLLEAILQVA